MAAEALTLRAAGAADADRLADMIVGLYADDPGPVPMSPERARRQVDLMLARPDHVWPLCLHDAGELVGYAILVPYFSNEFGGDVVTLDELYVCPAHRGRGVGGRLLEALVAWATQARVPRLELFVNQDNTRALPFYRRHGFEVARRALLARQLAEPGQASPTRPRPPGGGKDFSR